MFETAAMGLAQVGNGLINTAVGAVGGLAELITAPIGAAAAGAAIGFGAGRYAVETRSPWVSSPNACRRFPVEFRIDDRRVGGEILWGADGASLHVDTAGWEGKTIPVSAVVEVLRKLARGVRKTEELTATQKKRLLKALRRALPGSVSDDIFDIEVSDDDIENDDDAHDDTTDKEVRRLTKRVDAIDTKLEQILTRLPAAPQAAPTATPAVPENLGHRLDAIESAIRVYRKEANENYVRLEERLRFAEEKQGIHANT